MRGKVAKICANSLVALAFLPSISNSAPVEAKFDGDRAKIYMSSEYLSPAGFSFNPFNQVLETDFTENGGFEYDINGKKDFLYRINEGSSGHFVIDYFENFDMTEEDVAVSVQDVLSGGDPLDFNFSGMRLEEIVGMARRIDEISGIERGDNYWKYGVDLNAEIKGEASMVFDNKFVLPNRTKINIKSGHFASADFAINTYLNADVNWNKDSDGDARARIGYFHGCNVELGSFVEAGVSLPNGIHYGLGVIDKENSYNFYSKHISVGIRGDIRDLKVNAEFKREVVEEDIEIKEDVAYLAAGFEGDNGWVSFSGGSNSVRERGSREKEIEGRRLGLSVDGFENESLDLEFLEEVDSLRSDFIYSVSAGANVFNFAGAGVDFYGYSNSYFHKDAFGAGLRSDLVNVSWLDGDNYFGALKFFGRGGDFENDFKVKIKDKAGFLDGYVDEKSVDWREKRGGYVFAGEDDGIKRLGGTAGFDGFYLTGGSKEEDGKVGYFVGFGGKKVKVEGNYYRDKNGEMISLGMEFMFKDLSVMATTEITDKCNASSAMCSLRF